MKTIFLGAASSLAFALAASPAMAQHQQMPGMTMPTPAPAPTPTPAPAPAPAQADPHAGHAAPPPAAPPAEPAPVVDHNALDHGQMDHSQMDHGQTSPGGDHGGHAMTGALGAYPMAREASGTAWQPDASEHGGLMKMSGDWTLMAHGDLTLVHDIQGGDRGDSKTFVAGMLMGMARRDFANGDALQFKAMVSPDPLMGKSGYPLLLASGETADGVHRLIDRQHPHDFFMEMSASYAKKLGEKSSAFIYAALPGEPAFGPPAFMHRQAISVSPEAPITHHWLDSTHISFGVLIGGLVLDDVKLEVSRFNAREPDQHRWNIETGSLNSTAARISWNPAPEWSLQGSWGYFKDPEQLEPGINQRRWSASAAYTRPMARGWWATSLAWGRKTVEGEADDAFALESSLKHDDWTLFGRGEMTENRELLDDHVEEGGGHHGEAFKVGKLSLGVARDLAATGAFKVTAGVTGSINFVPDGLADAYGGKHPLGGLGFLRVSLN